MTIPAAAEAYRLAKINAETTRADEAMVVVERAIAKEIAAGNACILLGNPRLEGEPFPREPMVVAEVTRRLETLGYAVRAYVEPCDDSFVVNFYPEAKP